MYFGKQMILQMVSIGRRRGNKITCLLSLRLTNSKNFGEKLLLCIFKDVLLKLEHSVSCLFMKLSIQFNFNFDLLLFPTNIQRQ